MGSSYTGVWQSLFPRFSPFRNNSWAWQLSFCHPTAEQGCIDGCYSQVKTFHVGSCCFVGRGDVNSTFVAIRTEKQQANSVQPQCGLALQETPFCKVTTGVLGLAIGKSGLSVAATDSGFSLKLLSSSSSGMTGPGEDSCLLPLL